MYRHGNKTEHAHTKQKKKRKAVTKTGNVNFKVINITIDTNNHLVIMKTKFTRKV